MSKVYILFFCLVGCSSSNNWVKNGSSSYDIDEFEAAMVVCDYKDKMRTSNELMMWSNNTPPSRVPHSTDVGDGNFERGEEIKARDEKTIKSNSAAKQRSFELGRAAYGCMKDNGFERK